MEFIFTIFNILSSFLTDFLYKISLVNHLFIFDINKKNIYIKNNKINNKINDITSEINIKNISKKENNYRQNKNHSNLKKPNNKNYSIKKEILLVGRDLNIPKRTNKKAKTITTDFSSSSIRIENFEGKSKDVCKKEDISNIKTMNELDMNLNKEKEIKIEKKEIIDNIKINKFYFLLCHICLRKRKNINNYLLDEGIKIILKKLDILNIFTKMFLDEKIPDKNDYYIEMTEECKQKINEYKYKIA